MQLTGLCRHSLFEGNYTRRYDWPQISGLPFKVNDAVLPTGRALPRSAEGRAPVSWARPHGAGRSVFPPQPQLPSSLPASGGFAPQVPALAQQSPAHNALGGPLDDDEDYVIIDGPSPFSSGHASMCAAPPWPAPSGVQPDPARLPLGPASCRVSASQCWLADDARLACRFPASCMGGIGACEHSGLI